MSDTGLDFLRQAALVTRVRGIAGGNRIAWSTANIAEIADHIAKLPGRTLRTVAPTMHKLFDGDQTRTRKKLDEMSVTKREILPTDSKFIVKISNGRTDLADDRIAENGWDWTSYATNRVVLAQHDSSAIPVATSSMPWVSGDTVMAIATFPPPGTSTESDQVATAIRAGLLKGASVGFKPGRFSFSSDPARPLGIDFISGHRLLEWSFVSIPANSSCLVVGAVNEKAASSRNAPKDGPVDDGSEWECGASATWTIDASDDPFDATAAKAALVAKFSPAGTILPEEAETAFLANDESSPLDPASYRFPFCRVTDNRIVASKIGWRQAIAALEKDASMGTVIVDARAIVTICEQRLDEMKMAPARRKARVMTRDERIAEAAEIRRRVDRLLR